MTPTASPFEPSARLVYLETTIPPGVTIDEYRPHDRGAAARCIGSGVGPGGLTPDDHERPDRGSVRLGEAPRSLLAAILMPL